MTDGKVRQGRQGREMKIFVFQRPPSNISHDLPLSDKGDYYLKVWRKLMNIAL
jgi:hypothetical protein